MTEQFHPDWDTLDGLLIWSAQRTDLFGGGSFGVPIPLFPDAPPMRYIPAAVSDIHSSYDSVCQELGHAYGFEHPWLRSRNSRAFRNFATISQQISLISRTAGVLLCFTVVGAIRFSSLADAWR